MSRHRINLAMLLCCAGLLTLFGLTSRFAWERKSPTYDEPVTFASALLIAHDGDFRCNPEDPPLAKYVAAIGTNPSAMPVERSAPEWNAMLGEHSDGDFASKALFDNPRVDGGKLIDAARGNMILLAILLAALCGWWSFRLAGPIAGLVATAAICLDPNFLANGPLVKDDVPQVLALVALMFGVWRLGQKATLVRCIAVSILLAAALCTKFSGVFAIPILAVALGARSLLSDPWIVLKKNLASRGGRLLASMAIFIIAILVGYLGIWACYRFQFAPDLAGKDLFDVNAYNQIVAQRQIMIDHGFPKVVTPETSRAWYAAWRPDGLTRLVDEMSNHRLLPQGWLMGFLFTYGTSLMRQTYFCGQHGVMGWWFYFPMAIAFKTPLATLLAVALAMISLRSVHARGGRTHWYWIAAVALSIIVAIALRPFLNQGLREILPNFTSIVLAIAFVCLSGLIAWMFAGKSASWWSIIALATAPVIYSAIALHGHINLGLRHILPVYPFIFIFLGTSAAAAQKRWPRATMVIVGMFILGLAIECFSAYPNYIPFFNSAVGGWSGGRQLLSDSNIDWGQELEDLARWQRANPSRPLYLSYFGSVDPSFYDIRFSPLTPQSLDDSLATQPNAAYAISVVALQGVYVNRAASSILLHFRDAKPEEVLGGSIYIFRRDK